MKGAVNELRLSRPGLCAALAALVPHAGRATPVQPHLGRIRLALTAESLVLWASDGVTSALAQVRVEIVASSELEVWDLSVPVVRKVLGVFRKSATRASEDTSLEVITSEDSMRLTEVGGLFPGESLRVPRHTPPEPEEDTAIDVPRLVLPFLRSTLSTWGTAQLGSEDLAPFVTSAKQFGGALEVLLVDEPAPLVVLRSLDEAFLGVAHRVDRRGDEERCAEQRQESRSVTRSWARLVEPLQRPERVEVDDATREALLAAAGEQIAEHGKSVRLRVIRDELPLEADDQTAESDDDRDGERDDDDDE
ncbi:hypothetical protein [Serinibacter salmoneus]|uniref:Uncharacterized protein n=1 Tax=Serinibacter salmoneus TaxID=556530 RepID=A0A2A9CZJ3_9MICO|nr:hypothetical protein [Serinibacter salmoneus]PFG19844.1 hypothetical protein ATL40_1420 [Serinibacter salmoneus]